MKNAAEEKMEFLVKYVPFIDFVLKIDPQKYVKFSNIRKWILLKKKKYPLSDLNKIEQSIITQYKNLLLEKKVQIPQDITDIFAPLIFNQFVNLCSDDEDETQNEQNSIKNTSKVSGTPKNLAEKRRQSNTNRMYSKPKIEYLEDVSEDDDLEIISVDCVGKMGSKTKKEPLRKPSITNRIVTEEEGVIDEVSQDILSKIDKLTADDIKMKSNVYEPINYTYNKENDRIDSTESEGVIYQRRTTDSDLLFKRRADFEDKVVVKNLVNEKKFHLIINKSIEIISLDSGSESEGCNDDERPSTSKAAISNKTSRVEETVGTTLEENEQVVESTDSNSNGSSSTNKRLELLCNSIDADLPDMCDLLNGSKDVNNDSTIHLCDKQLLEGGGSDKENSIITMREKSVNNKNTPDLTPEEISKLLEDISSKSDFEWEIFYEALNICQANSGQGAPSETPPPAPPPIANNFPTPPVQPGYIPQQQIQFTPPLTSNYPQNSNFAPMAAGVRPSMPKINLNDPRIKKQLQLIQNSPLFTYNVLNAGIGENMRKICPPPQCQQQPHPQQQQSSFSNNTAPCSRASTSTHKSKINYGEYKRRELAKKLEMERQREEERKAKAKAEMEREQEKLQLSQNKNEESIRSKLLSTLSPCRDRLTTLWSQQSHNFDGNKSNTNMEKEQQKEDNIQIEATSSEERNTVELSNCKKKQEEISLSRKETNQSNNKKEENSSHNKNKERKLSRVYNELKCTVKGFDQIQDYLAEESPDKSGENNQPRDTIEVRVTPKPVGLRRRSSMHALSAITLQLGQLSSDDSDSTYSSKRHLRNSSSENLSNDSSQYSPKRRKTIDDIIRTTARSSALRITDDGDASSEDEGNINEGNINVITNENLIIKKSYVKLDRMSNDFIRKHTKRAKKDSTCAQSVTNEQSIRLKKTSEKVKNLKEPGQKMPKLKKYNNDCQMTERNTDFCALCRSKPSDLTNHYIGRHKTESYVSRLDWSELEDLATNTPFAKLQLKNKNSRFEKYEVECPFCRDKVCDQFINLYNHYATHTGEYAFQCAHCNLCKPYRPDIQSHILHSKACRNSSIQVMYRYPPQAQCIYLHYCTICNFVQLNEANVLKHLREHHDCSKAIVSNVQKCILTAMSDGPEANQSHKSPSPTPLPVLETLQQENAIAEGTAALTVEGNHLETNISANEMKFKVDDDDIPVSNEPCLEDDYLEEGNYSLEEQLKKMHTGRSIINNSIPMTVIHCTGNKDTPPLPSVNVARVSNLNSREEAPRHLPIQVKKEEPQDNSQSVLGNDSVYEKYRSYPPNVNYLGLYKCMIGDCFYATDCCEEIVKHLTEHYTDELKSNEYLQCPYCIIKRRDIPITPEQLVEHVRTQHGHLNFQCSMCCYRSSNASNVHSHQKIHHENDIKNCKIYKCSSDVPKVNNTDNDLKQQVAKNIFAISCRICNLGFFYTQFLINHLHMVHNVPNAYLQIYSCIYCPFMVENQNLIRFHIATKHPGEQPLAYDHNKQINYNNKDIKCSSNVVDISETVAWNEVAATVNADDILQDLKPDFQELLRMNEETAKVRLQKLTTNTGVSPDCLYRCPGPICGGFFSNFELWLRHVKVRHHTFECACPHCPTVMLLPLEQFALHFELHRRHTFLCFYCSTTCPTEQLARQHAIEKHSDFEPMRFEKIHFNISYSYYIMIQRDLFNKRENFISELLYVLENRLKELENIEIKKLKQRWPVRDNTPWIDDYLQIFSKRKVALRCLVKDCQFVTLGEENLYRHISTSHNISDTKFKCSKCDYQLEKCHNLIELFNHIKLHSEYIFICTACSLNTPSRTRMSSHIIEQHSARDVPVIHLFRTSERMYIKIYIVFSNNHLTFSTMKRCFCCSEQNMNGDVFSLHLKHYHKLSLNYYCEKCNNFLFKSLKEVKPHFEQFHHSNNFKISCELASHNDLNVASINDFQIKILTPDSVSQYVKTEPVDESDNDVILMEDNDVEITNSLKEEQLKQAQRPQLKLTSLSKLLEPSINHLSSHDNWIFASKPPESHSGKYCQPSGSCINGRFSHQESIPANSRAVTTTNNLTVPSTPVQPSYLHSNFINPKLQRQFTAVSSLPPTNVVAPTSYDHYNFNSTTINSSAASNSSHIVYNDTVISSNLPNTNIPPPQIGILPSHVENQVNINTYLHVPPNSLHMGQTSHMQSPIHIPTSVPFLITPKHCNVIPIQNPTNNF